MADIALLGGLVTGVEHDNDHSAAAHEVQPVARTVVNPHLGDFAFDRLPVSEASCFCLPKARCDADLRALVLQGVEPSDELLGLADGERAATVAIWIQIVKRTCVWCGLTFELNPQSVAPDFTRTRNRVL